jgi:hypothetical protein
MILTIIFLVPMIYYTISFSRDVVDAVGWVYEIDYLIGEGYRFNLLGDLLLIIIPIIKIALIVYTYTVRRYNYSLIKKSKYGHNFHILLSVKRVSVNPKVPNSCMKPANSQQDNRDYNNSRHFVTLELTQKQPS